MEKNVTTPVVKGLIIALALIIYGLALYFTGYFMNQGLSYVQYAIIIGGVIWSCTSYAKQMNYNVTFGNVFAHGFKVTAVATVIVIMYSVISFKFLFPEMIDAIIEKSREAMAEKNISDDQVDSVLDKTKQFFIPLMIAGILFGFLFTGVIASLIGAGIAKKKPSDPFVNQVNPV